MNGHRIIFAGPSLNASDYQSHSDVVFLPPCKQGDVFLATLEKPSVIGIIDGFFEGMPSVWHKEILWALDQGIHVVGASSMGALRAAELDVFGMTGLGQVYEWYRDRKIEDDDEVALQHAPEEMDYLSLSIPMVNVRANCNAAKAEKVFSEEACEKTASAAKSIFYKNRNWDIVLEQAILAGVGANEIEAFKAWLAKHEIDQKRLDAIKLCDFIANENFETSFESEFEFEYTEFWHRCIKQWQVARENKRGERSGSDGYRLFD